MARPSPLARTTVRDREGLEPVPFRRRPFACRAWIFPLAWILASVPPPALAGTSLVPPRNGAPGMSEPRTGSLLADYYDTYLRDHDIDAFRVHVSARYTEGTLARLIDTGDTQTRRGAVLAMGLFGSFEVNAAVGRALRDNDATVRALAENALWAIWFRADSPENNKTLERVRALIGRQQYDDAVAVADRLIKQAPKFAEAYNQRAIAYFFLGRFEESAADCQRVLEHNPYHIGALGGLAQCQLQLDKRDEALKTLRRSLKLQPHKEDLRDVIAALEAEGN